MNIPKIQNKTKAPLLWCLLFLPFVNGDTKKEKHYIKNEDQAYLNILENDYKNNIRHCIIHLDSLLLSGKNTSFLTANYVKSRMYFKQAEPVIAAIDKNNYASLNAPNILKVEEEDATDIKVQKPFGFQVIEEMLHETPIDTIMLHKMIINTRSRLQFLLYNTKLSLKPYHILWLIRAAIIRTATTGITGFDSPVFENSLEEARTVYRSLTKIITLYQPFFKEKEIYEKWHTQFQQTQYSLKDDFKTFNRYTFIKKHTHPQLALWVKTVKDWKVSYPFEMAIRHETTSLFSREAFNLKYFSNLYDTPYDNDKITLGELLFNDKNLSARKDMSCATCHQKEKAFTDGMTTFPKQHRNTPTLLYAALQKGFFYDKRSGSLEGQMISVIANKDEFHTTPDNLVKVVSENNTYTKAFDRLYAGKITDATLRNAIATYIRSLMPFNSRFDHNINGISSDLTEREIHGFNLFMGKAKCATCHFPPVFNGTVPPNFKESEMELLGVPEKADGSPVIDDDLGRYYVFKTKERKYFFKTPTVRNSSKTAPYMHNGVYHTLEDVMDFYNHGGGRGMGINLPLQTLPSDSLHLSQQEIQDIIAFIKTLEDTDI